MDGVAILRKLGACSDAIEWVQSINDNDRAWNECKRSDWMFWLLAAVRYREEKPLRRIACECLRGVWDRLNPKSRLLIEMVERYCDGRADWQSVTRARSVARSAARSVADRAADRAAGAAARSVAYLSGAAAYWAADSVAYLSAADSAARKRLCEIIRKHIPLADILTLAEN
jgi:hypothetical protein